MALENSVINNNVYLIVNDIAKQALGSINIDVVDTKSFVDFGNAIINSSDYTETFMQTLLLRIARTYETWRPYESSLRDLVISGEEWGAIYQKIDAEVPDFVSDETFELVDGKSVDQYVVRKPTAKQKLFVKRSTYQNYVTMTRKLLQGAFLSEAEFVRFTRQIEGKMRIKLDFAMENMARLAIASYIANADSTKQVVNLVTDYNTETGETLTAATALHDKDFLAYAAGTMELYSKRLRNLSTAYNKENMERHTPRGEQRFLVFDLFQSRLQHVVQYQSYHDDLVALKEFIEVPYWQAEKDRSTIKVTREDGTTVTLSNVVGFIFDRYALGTFMSDEETLSTPMNARARYWNVFHFAEQLWFNDLSENGVVFTLN